MEPILNNAKRKKRKTRKCLDEIRKRSQINSTKNNSASALKQAPKMNVPIASYRDKIKTNNNCITTKRLTLTMFAKAVRSETITRPLVDDKHDHKLVLNTKSPVTSPINIVVESKSSDDSEKICDAPDILVKQRDYENSLDQDSNSSDSIIWFSPTRPEERQQFRDFETEDTISTVTSNSRSNEDFGYHLYEELIEDIPLYAQRNLSNFIKNDVMKKTSTRLQSLFMEMFSQNKDNIEIDVLPKTQETSIFTSDRSYTSPKNVIVQNPMDYIKFGWQRGFHHSSDSTPSDGTSPLHSPPRSSPLAHTQMPSVISITPDYDFYPHRLNE